MTPAQASFLGITFVFIFLASLIAQFNWLRPGMLRAIVVFLLAAVAMVALGLGGIPPKWFNGSKTGFALGLSFLAGALIPDAQSFRRPFFLGLGLPVVVFNVLAHL